MNRGGFSLVEVVMALGIAAFALVSMLGLFSVGIGAGKHSGEDTEISAMSLQVISRFRNITNNAIPASTNLYFDYQGRYTNTANPLFAYYECKLTTQSASATEISSDTTSLLKAKMTFCWPSTAAQRPNTNIVHATFSPR